jgi:hypothetical protein
MKHFLLLCCILLCNTITTAQKTCDSYYMLSSQMDSLTKLRNIWMSDYQLQALNGHYALALLLADKENNQDGKYNEWFTRTTFTKKQAEKLVIKDARSEIYQASRTKDFMVMNESHHVPAHRAFLHTMLDSLYAIGYRNLYVEGLNNIGNKNEKVDRIVLTGNEMNFIQEKYYANMLKYALKLGFALYPYENNFVKHHLESKDGNTYLINDSIVNWKPVPMDSFCIERYKRNDQDQLRDLFMAANIFQNYNEKMAIKSIIYCGYNHAMKEGGNMASFLKHITQKNPLTIDQTYMNEGSDTAFEFKLYKWLNVNSSSVVFDTLGKSLPYSAFSLSADTSRKPYDFIVFHPRSKKVNGRYIWEYINKTRCPVPHFDDIYNNLPKRPILAKVFYQEKFLNGKQCGTPADIVEITDHKNPPVFLLDQNVSNYHVFYYDTKGFISEYSQEFSCTVKDYSLNYSPKKILFLK